MNIMTVDKDCKIVTESGIYMLEAGDRIVINEITASDVGHVTLDVIGLIPGLEPADFANALWYAKEGKYFAAAVSIISLLPAVGDVIAKPIKYLGGRSKAVAAFLVKYGDDIAKYWDEAMKLLGKVEGLKKYEKEIDAAVKTALRVAQKAKGGSATEEDLKMVSI